MHAAAHFCAASRELHGLEDLRSQLRALRDSHRRACALVCRCGDWDARFRRGSVSQINWVSIGLVLPDLQLLARMCASAHLRTTLMRLNLRDNGITGGGLVELANGLVQLPFLEYLNLESNSIGLVESASDDIMARVRSTGIYRFIHLLGPTDLPFLHVLQLADSGLDVDSAVGKAIVEVVVELLLDGQRLPTFRRFANRPAVTRDGLTMLLRFSLFMRETEAALAVAPRGAA